MNSRDGSVPTSDETEVEAQIVRAGATAPRITPEHIDAQIKEVYFFTSAQAVAGSPYSNSMAFLTFCVLVLQNGFTVTGESACASPENYREQIGRDIAYRNARDKISALEGYQLRTLLARQTSFKASHATSETSTTNVDDGYPGEGEPT